MVSVWFAMFGFDLVGVQSRIAYIQAAAKSDSNQVSTLIIFRAFIMFCNYLISHDF